jgi:endonuclease/exonuclease/phosphatase family metal-dependent hydrolase
MSRAEKFPVLLAGLILFLGGGRTSILRGENWIEFPTNTVVRVMAANLTSGSSQRYEAAGLNILRGLKPDVIAIQEFNYASTHGLGVNTPAAVREMVDFVMGTNSFYFRESSSTETYDLPNGILSRFPIVRSGSWDDILIPNRGFAWAEIDVPGPTNLYLVSVHLKASSGSSSTRTAEAANLRSLVNSRFPTNAWVLVAGDFNISSSSETALGDLKEWLSDWPVPTDAVALGDPDTNAGRSERYDYVLASFTLTNLLSATVMASATFSNGLVFDSRVYSPLTDVPPVDLQDSAASGMQHMAVIKDFRIPYAVQVAVPEPELRWADASTLQWEGPTNLTYRVLERTNWETDVWRFAGTATSATGTFRFTNEISGKQRFYRVVVP